MDWIRTQIERLDNLLDCIPVYYDGHWYRNGGWGCRWHLHRFWDDGK